MSRPSIKMSLTAIFAVIALLFMSFAWLAVDALTQVDSKADEIALNWLPSVKAVKEIETETLNLRIAYLAHITATSPEANAAAEKSVATQTAAIDAAVKVYEPLTSSDRERVVLKEFQVGMAGYQKAGEALIVLSSANSDDEALAQLDKMRAAVQPPLKNLAELVSINMNSAQLSVQQSGDTYDTAILQTYVMIVIAGLVILAATVYALRSVAMPIQKITGSMKDLAAGSTQKIIPYAGRADEIGSMAGAVEVFRQAALENIRMSADAEFQRKSNDEQRIVAQQRAEEDARHKLLEATGALATGMKKLAAGDLTFKISEPVSVDFEGLRDDFNAAVTQLSQTMSSVTEATNAIDGGTREIADGANDLSKRTEQQAASLEETAAALDEITVNVRNSSQRTEEARSVAVLANQNAAKSAEVVSQAVDAMKRIEESSQQISNIIGVIDEIAFQTNLLALNAGVEAARAGEAGKGFAVVAQEVRELAQRSAQAAKEIKALITASGTQVSSGVSLVGQTGTALQAIGDYVVQINGLMDAIAVSAREQSTGLAEVNTAVNQMDQTTQQNAAMVEQSTAASAALASEAVRLRELVGQFRLPNAQAAAPSHQAHRGASHATHASAAQPARRPVPVSRGNTALKTQEWSEF